MPTPFDAAAILVVLSAGGIETLAAHACALRTFADGASAGVCHDAAFVRADELLRAPEEPDYKRRLRDGNALPGGTS